MSFGGKGGGHAGRFTFPEQHAVNNSKTPPGWGVEQESSYPFKCWCKDLITWAYATDLDPENRPMLLSFVSRAQQESWPRNWTQTLCHMGTQWI